MFQLSDLFGHYLITKNNLLNFKPLFFVLRVDILKTIHMLQDPSLKPSNCFIHSLEISLHDLTLLFKVATLNHMLLQKSCSVLPFHFLG